jgi:N-acetylglucosamine-6-phosphate deacetylase
VEPPIQTLAGRHYQTGQPITIHHQNGLITEIKPLESSQPHLLPFLAPPLLDLQVNGFAGVDFQQDNVSQDQLHQACQGLLAAGCTRFLLTLITDAWPRLTQRLAHLHQLVRRSQLASSMVAGWHIEGPFLSNQPGFHGAHPPELTTDPSPAAVDQIREITGQDHVLLTLAPERKNSTRTIEHALNLGLKISLGHTNATSRELQSAISAGASCFTHLGNACPQQLDRHDNILWRILDQLRPRAGDTKPPGRFHATLIPDEHHVSPALFRIIHAASAPHTLMYTSDAMAGAAAPPGPTTLGQLHLNIGEDGIARQPGKTNFAGSTLKPFEGVFHASRMLQAPWHECWDRFSTLPAKWMNLPPHNLQPGQPASACLLDFSRNSTLPDLTAVFLNGQQTLESSKHLRH